MGSENFTIFTGLLCAVCILVFVVVIWIWSVSDVTCPDVPDNAVSMGQKCEPKGRDTTLFWVWLSFLITGVLSGLGCAFL